MLEARHTAATDRTPEETITATIEIAVEAPTEIAIEVAVAVAADTATRVEIEESNRDLDPTHRSDRTIAATNPPHRRIRKRRRYDRTRRRDEGKSSLKVSLL